MQWVLWDVQVHSHFNEGGEKVTQVAEGIDSGEWDGRRKEYYQEYSTTNFAQKLGVCIIETL